MWYTIKFELEKEWTFYYERGKGWVNIDTLEIINELYVTYNLSKFFSKVDFHVTNISWKKWWECVKELLRVCWELQRRANLETNREIMQNNPISMVIRNWCEVEETNMWTRRESSFRNALSIAQAVLQMAMQNEEEEFMVF